MLKYIIQKCVQYSRNTHTQSECSTKNATTIPCDLNVIFSHTTNRLDIQIINTLAHMNFDCKLFFFFYFTSAISYYVYNFKYSKSVCMGQFSCSAFVLFSVCETIVIRLHTEFLFYIFVILHAQRALHSWS